MSVSHPVKANASYSYVLDRSYVCFCSQLHGAIVETYFMVLVLWSCCTDNVSIALFEKLQAITLIVVNACKILKKIGVFELVLSPSFVSQDVQIS